MKNDLQILPAGLDYSAEFVYNKPVRVISITYPPVAQLDNATDSDSGEREFKSLRAGHRKHLQILSVGVFYYNFVSARPKRFASDADGMERICFGMSQASSPTMGFASHADGIERNGSGRRGRRPA